MTAYYNENDPKAAAWLRELIRAGHIAPGDVDERNIEDVKPDELVRYTQCHFFAGIGGWSAGLRLAGWADNTPVWTGSCPCQPFSAAGKNDGVSDERHLWPAFFWLIGQCSPATVFGEQVASKLGRAWLSGVRADLETLGYAVGAADLCAASVSAPHIRQRLWWVADANNAGSQGQGILPECSDQLAFGSGGLACRMEYADSPRRSAGRLQLRPGRPQQAAIQQHWADPEWLDCADGKTRRIEPGLEPLAHGLPARVGRLRGYGNAIVPQVAAEFVSAFLGAA